MSHAEFAAVSTSLTVRKWDADQAEWVLRREDERAAGLLRAGRHVTVPAETFARHRVEPYETWHRDNCNNIVQAGWVALLGGIAGTTITNKFGSANGRIGVGTSTTAVSYSQTALVGDTGAGSTTSYYQLVSGAPAIATASSPPTLTFTATFGTGVANFAWNEFGTDNYTASSVTTTGLGASYVFINRGLTISGPGTKTSGLTWSATETMTFGYPSGSGSVS